MCGVVGFVNGAGKPADLAVLRRMTARLAHRGPDGEGFHIDGDTALGHRRLAIIDLSDAAGQPMVSADGRYVLSYNGEIYNFREIRAELQTLGHHFRSKSDTEVVLRGYAEWGLSLLDRLNGMFAFAIWDSTARELFIVRDRYGIKPLYYVQRDGFFAFASEIKALLDHPDIHAKMDRAGLFEYFSFQNFFTDKTLFEGVRLLPAGCWMKVRADRIGLAEPRRYWDYSFAEPDHRADDQAYLEELERLFRQAVRRQMVSDVELGTYLSGGIDSGSITAFAAQESAYIKTFTCGFDMNSISGLEIGFDERVKAEYMSYLFKTEHYEMVLKAGDMERVIPRLTWHMEEPRVGQSYPNFYVAQLASRFVKVVLAGTGGDELFAGYPWRYYRAVVNDDFDHYIDKYYGFWQRLIPSKDIQNVFKPIWKDVEDVVPKQIFRDVFLKHAAELTRPEDYINHSLYFEAKTFLHGLLVVDDKLSMAHSLETRVPFLDNDLVDFAQRLPTHLKLGELTNVIRMNENEPGPKTDRYFQRTRDGKIALRQVMEKHVPKEITEGIKQGFSAPDATWFRGESIEYVKRRLFNKDAHIYEFLDRKSVEALMSDHLENRENRRLLIWSLLNVEEWCTQFLN